MTRGGALWLVVLLLLAVPRAAPGEEEGWLLNYDRVRLTAADAVRDLLDDFPPPAGGLPVRVSFIESHETAWMVGELSEEELIGRSIPVTEDTLRQAVELEIKVIELGMRYTAINRRFLFGTKRVERLAVATLSAQARDVATGELAWHGVGEARSIDEVPESKLPILEGNAYPFTAPARPASSTSKVVEPIIVAGIVVGLVFLFISNRN
jgi:hypothetical protein